VIPLPVGEVKRTCSIKVTLLKGAEVGPGPLDSIESCPLLRQATRILGQGGRVISIPDMAQRE